jgi:hypothetical protein
MDEEERLRQALKSLGNTPSGVFPATVDAVSGEVADVTALDETQYFDVQLKAAINGKGGMIIIPAVGSTVLVERINGSNRLFIAMFSEIEEVVFNQGENGLVKIDMLTDKLNELVKAFNSHVHSGIITAVSGGSGAPAVGTPGNSGKPTQEASEFKQEDYEDTKIKH